MEVSLDGGAPTQLASEQIDPIAIAVDHFAVYWSNLGTLFVDSDGGRVAGGENFEDGSLVKVQLDGGAPVTLTPVAGPLDIAVDSTSVYSVSGRILKTPLGGGAPLTLFGGPILLGHIALGGENVYWTSQAFSSPDICQGQSPWGCLQSCAITGCNGTPNLLASLTCSPVSLAVDANNVYWAGSGCFASELSSIMSLSLAGGEPTPLVSGNCQLGPIAVDGTATYWAQDDAIVKCPLGGCGGAPTVIVSGRSGFGGIAIDAANVYWTEPGNAVRGGIVARVAK